MKIFPNSFKNCLTRRAAQALNDLCNWVNNFAQGFGIKVYRLDKGVAVGINQEDEELVKWIKFVSASQGKEAPVDVSASTSGNDQKLWDREMNKNLQIYLPSSVVTSYNGNPDVTAIVMRQFTFSANGTLLSVDKRSIKQIYGQS